MAPGGRCRGCCIRPRGYLVLVLIFAAASSAYLFRLIAIGFDQGGPTPTRAAAEEGSDADLEADLLADLDVLKEVARASRRGPAGKSGTAALPFLKEAQPDNTLVSVYHFLDNEDREFGARWLYGVVPASGSNVFFDLGRTLVTRSHEDLNDRFELKCPCPKGPECPMSKGRYKRSMKLLSKFFGQNSFPCTQVHPLAISKAKSLGYDSIQITDHVLDTKNVTILGSPEETAKGNRKFEIIDLTSDTVANWVGHLELPHYRVASGQPCKMMSRQVLPHELPWFGSDQQLLACDEGDSDSGTAHTANGRCAEARSRVRFHFYSHMGWLCKVKLGSLRCDPWDPQRWASNGCFIKIPSAARSFRGRGSKCTKYTGRSVYPPRADVPKFSSCALVGEHRLLAGAGCGADIDGHEAVFRADVPATQGLERDIGSRFNVSLASRALAERMIATSSGGPAVDLRNATAVLMEDSAELCDPFLCQNASLLNAERLFCSSPFWDGVLSEFDWGETMGLVGSAALKAALFAGSRCRRLSVYGFPKAVHSLLDALAKLDHAPLCPRNPKKDHLLPVVPKEAAPVAAR